MGNISRKMVGFEESGTFNPVNGDDDVGDPDGDGLTNWEVQ